MYIHNVKEFQLYSTNKSGKQIKVNRSVIIEAVEDMFNSSECDLILSASK